MFSTGHWREAAALLPPVRVESSARTAIRKRTLAVGRHVPAQHPFLSLFQSHQSSFRHFSASALAAVLSFSPVAASAAAALIQAPCSLFQSSCTCP